MNLGWGATRGEKCAHLEAGLGMQCRGTGHAPLGFQITGYEWIGVNPKPILVLR